LQRFWEALQQAKVTDGLLHLDGAWLMGDQLRGQDLLMRECYISFLDRIKVLLAQGLRRFLITGEDWIRLQRTLDCPCCSQGL
jgi:hypothetical protein